MPFWSFSPHSSRHFDRHEVRTQCDRLAFNSSTRRRWSDFIQLWIGVQGEQIVNVYLWQSHWTSACYTASTSDFMALRSEFRGLNLAPEEKLFKNNSRRQMKTGRFVRRRQHCEHP
jgi:hypothetical protein